MNKIAILTSGGDAPGMNACIRAVVRSAQFFGLETYGVIRGYEGLIQGDFIKLGNYEVSNIVQNGGTFLKTCRSKEFETQAGRKKALENLRKAGIGGLIVIGGNGTLQGCSLFYNEHNFPCIGIPGTIDNDLYGTDFTIGYDTAVNTVLSTIDNIRDTADSHERVFFIEVMGRDSGYIAIQSAIAGGAEVVVIPEVEKSSKEIIQKLSLGQSDYQASQIVVVTEDDTGRRAQNIAADVCKSLPDLDARVVTLGHVQRGGAPSAADRVLAGMLGTAAVSGLIKNKSNVMVGINNGTPCFVPLLDTFTRKKVVSYDFIKMFGILNENYAN